ncbi:MAG: autotransporter assembly complex protein TamA [Proteobacteria bacterium]|nr:autotransporter assembly complex protein TamA [Pseudomonadota bacterium]
MSIRSTFIAFFIAVFVVAALPATQSVAQSPEEGDTPPAVNGGKIIYSLKIEGAPNDDVAELLEQSSRLEQLNDTPPTSKAGLRRRIQDDVEGFNKVLRSEGYYNNKVEFELDDTEIPAKITFNITAGTLFRISKFEIVFTKARLEPEPLDMEAVGIKIGMPARSEDIISAQRLALTDLSNTGYPAAKLADQSVVVDFATNGMEVTLTFNAGPRLKMGQLELTGLETVDENYLRKLAEWEPDVPYDASRIDLIRRRYLRSGLFTSIRLQPREVVEADEGTVPVVLSFVERASRSVGVGASFSTSEGAGSQFYWEHRNLFGEGEKLRADLTIAEIRREVTVAYTKPNYRKIDQNFNARLDLKHENTEAYKEDSVSTFVGLDRRWRERWVLGIGGSLEYAEIDDDGSTDNFTLAGIPMYARYDSTDDLLDPKKGIRFGANIVPYVGLNDITPDFLRTEFDASTYFSVLRKDRLILAARGKIGMMAGDSTSDIPATKRFYAGGGGSIRGYKFQTVGPLDAQNDPIGGRSLVEVGFEARTRITENIGIVPFIEGGNVYESMVPDFSEDFLWGAGIGFRYFTAVGPIRFDIAVPLDKRKNVDDSFQFYISIGQAF